MLKKIKDSLKACWAYLSGKKTIIASIYWGLAIPAIAIIYPAGAPTMVTKVVAIIGLVFTYVGLGHKMVKTVLGPDQQ